MNSTYICWDESGIEKTFDAISAQDAAEEYVYGGYWDHSEKTQFIEIQVMEEDSDYAESITVTIDPDEGECDNSEDSEHDYQSPFELLGGLKENPGVFGNGCGVIIKEVCANCGKYKTVDTWTQNPVNGQQGLHSVKFEDADEQSLKWISSQSVEV